MLLTARRIKKTQKQKKTMYLLLFPEIHDSSTSYLTLKNDQVVTVLKTLGLSAH